MADAGASADANGLNEVRASRVGEGLRVQVTAREHSIVSDVLVSEGGTDLGQTPHELLASALAACTSMTVQMYANRKKWPLNRCDVTVRVGKGTSVGTDTGGAAVGSTVAAAVNTPKTIFDVTVSFDGVSDPDQRVRLLDIAHKCPVHRVLTHAINVNVVAV